MDLNEVSYPLSQEHTSLYQGSTFLYFRALERYYTFSLHSSLSEPTIYSYAIYSNASVCDTSCMAQLCNKLCDKLHGYLNSFTNKQCIVPLQFTVSLCSACPCNMYYKLLGLITPTTQCLSIHSSKKVTPLCKGLEMATMCSPLC